MGTKQKLIDSINADTTKANNLKREDYVKAAKEGFAGDQAAEEGVINSAYDKAAANVQAVNDKKVSDTNAEYASQYERNAVQKLINEKQVAEKMANLGLTDSGLNRTQQTAVQLSYANQKGKIDLAKQSALDNLALNLTSALSDIESNRNIDLLESKQKWNDKAYSVGETNYNNDLTAINDRITSAYEQYGKIAEAEIEAAAKAPAVSYGAGGTYDNNFILRTKDGLLSRNYYGTLKENGVDTVYNYDEDGNVLSVTYTDNNSGKQTTIAYGKNPYTGEDNINGNSDAAKAVKRYGAYGNGYQPKGVYINGKDYGKMVEVVDKTDPKITDGMIFNIFKTSQNGTHYWVWDATINNYAEVVKTGGEWKFKEE